MMSSIRKGLIWGTCTGVAVVLAVAGSFIYMSLQNDFVDQFDHSLQNTARLLASTVERGPDWIDLEFLEGDMTDFEKLSQPAYLQLWLDDGTVIFRSSSLGTLDIERPPANAGASFGWVTLPDGQPGRAIRIVFKPRVVAEEEEMSFSKIKWNKDDPTPEISLVLARDTAEMDHDLSQLLTIFILAGIAAMAASSVILWVVIHRNLVPLDRLSSRIEDVDEQALTTRLAVGDVPAELRPVVVQLNNLLSRLKEAFHRERSFSADVAHELRTPLAGLRTIVEVSLTRPRDVGEYEDTLGECLQVIVQMQDMVEKLLSLARLETEETRTSPEPVIPDEMIEECWKDLRETADSRRLSIEWQLAAKTPVVTDRLLFDLVIRNILENAVCYSDEGGWVRFETSSTEEGVKVTVSNSGSVLPQNQTECVFDRFWRADSSRTATGIHCGLGLTLVNRVANILHGSVEVVSSEGGEFRISILIPSLPEKKAD